jgi:hypothetical protein
MITASTGPYPLQRMPPRYPAPIDQDRVDWRRRSRAARSASVIKDTEIGSAAFASIATRRRLGNISRISCSRLPLAAGDRKPGNVCAGTRKTGDQPGFKRGARRRRHHNRYCLRRILGGPHRRGEPRNNQEPSGIAPIQHADDRHHLLCARRKWPHSRRGDETN